jgi:hypothetical protein
MSAETVLYTALSTTTTVDSLVDGRVYPDIAPQDASLPAIAFERTGTEYINTIHGDAIATKAMLAIYCMAETRADAEGLCDVVADAVRAADFTTIDRRAEFNAEQALWATVLEVQFWE